MPFGRRKPEVAHAEEYDSDESHVKPNTRVDARSRPQPSRSSSKAVERVQRPDPRAASDSGYSSQTFGSTSTGQVRAVVPVANTSARTVVPPSPSRSKPIIHRSESQRSSRPQAPSRSTSVSRSQQPVRCTDPNCGDPSCLSTRNNERRYTLPAQQPQAPQQYQVPYLPTNAQYQQQVPQYQYAQMNTTQPVPTLATPRPRAPSASQSARPVSWAPGAYTVPYPITTSQQGPPPSPSAYQTQTLYSSSPAYQYPPQIYGSTPPTQITPAYPPPSPLTTSPQYPARPGLPHQYSARQNVPTATAFDAPKSTSQPMLTRTSSARQAPSARTSTMPGTFYDTSASESESESECESETGSSEDERERQAKERARKRDSKLMPPPRRPSLKPSYTTSAVPSRSSREPLRRAPVSDGPLDYPSSSDYVDSDRTRRADVAEIRDRRSSATSSRSRRPSVSTEASSRYSGRTKATTLSSGSQVIVEDKHGRRRAYLSREDEERLMRKFQQQRLEEQVRAYQEAVSGPQPPELTAENILKQQRRASGSHISSGSRKSNQSQKSHKSTKSEGIQISANGTVLNVSGDAKIEIRHDEEGRPQFIVASASGRDSAYHSSQKSSNSRQGRSRGGSDLGRREETIYEDRRERV